ncbi:MAG: hypothetical protein QOI78_3078 [Actinomycetota bacterium]|jgi:hypothetical protein|nr:hypothetical protein [Actinomycetota bacterium]
MYAQPGDWLVVKGPRVDAPEQGGRILEVCSAEGTPPYVVRWTADDPVSPVFPGPAAIVLRSIHEEDGHARVH